jgi:hypothetical protein
MTRELSSAGRTRPQAANPAVGHGRDIPWLSLRNTANPVSNKPAATRSTHAIAVTSPFVRVMSYW